MWRLESRSQLRVIDGNNSNAQLRSRMFCDVCDARTLFVSNMNHESVRGVSWSEVATVPKRKSHRGLDLSLNSEKNIWKGWKKSGGKK